MTEEEEKQQLRELIEGIRQRHPLVVTLAGAWKDNYGDHAFTCFEQGVILGYKAAYDDRVAGVWDEIEMAGKAFKGEAQR